MPLELDGTRVLQALLDAPDVFPHTRGELNRIAQGVVVKELRSRALTIEGLRQLAECLGFDSFRLVCDAMSDAETKSLALRMDPHNAGARKAGAAYLRSLLLELAEGEREPEPGPKGNAKAEPAPLASRTMSSRAMAAVAKPRDDAPVRVKAKQEKAKQEKAKPDKGKAKGKPKRKGKK